MLQGVRRLTKTVQVPHLHLAIHLHINWQTNCHLSILPASCIRHSRYEYSCLLSNNTCSVSCRSFVETKNDQKMIVDHDFSPLKQHKIAVHVRRQTHLKRKVHQSLSCSVVRNILAVHNDIDWCNVCTVRIIRVVIRSVY